MAITAEYATARLQAYLDAEAKILSGQQVEMDGKVLRRADLALVQKGIEIWSAREANLLNSGRIQVREVIPR